MRSISLAAILILLIAVSAVSIEAKDMDSEVYGGDFTYIIGPGDVLEINVWRHPDLDTRVRVRPDGKVSFPLIKEISVFDLTPPELKKELAQKLSKIIRDPEVTVNVVSFQSKKIFVLGEVNRPGVYPFEGRVSVLDAISKAFGYKEDTAALKSVIVIKRGYTPKPKALRLNIWNLITKGDISQDIFLEPGDIVFVPRTFIANVNKFIDQFFTKTDPALKYYLDIIDIDQRTPAGRLR